MKKISKLLALAMTFAMVICLCACGETKEVDTSPITEAEISSFYTAPNDFKGRTFEFTGQVMQVEKSDGVLYLQVWQDIKNFANNTVVVFDDSEFDVDNEAFVKVTGSVDGEFKGENALGGEVSAPQITASSVEVITAVEAFPATKTIEVNQSVTKGDYTATVTKVDYTKNETRIYLTVENNGSDSFDNYPDQGVIIQNGIQHEANWNYLYPTPSTEIKGGAKAECVVSFDKVDESDFTYSFNGYDAVSFEELEFVFDIVVK